MQNPVARCMTINLKKLSKPESSAIGHCSLICVTTFIYCITQTLYADEDLCRPLQLIGLETEGISEWKNKSFAGETQYQIVSENGNKILKATSNDSASALYKDLKINLIKYPFLEWQWRVEQRVHQLDEKTKAGDDYAARVYVVARTGWLPWQVKAINYVWSFDSPKGDYWHNPFTQSAMMISMRSPSHRPGVWQYERVDIKADFKRYFGLDIDRIDGVAIMTDSDNSHSRSVAYYSDIKLKCN